MYFFKPWQKRNNGVLGQVVNGLNSEIFLINISLSQVHLVEKFTVVLNILDQHFFEPSSSDRELSQEGENQVRKW